MQIAIFGHSVLADWSNPGAHFMRGLLRELHRLGHQAIFYEESDNWATRNQVSQVGRSSLLENLRIFPFLQVRLYRSGMADPLPFLRHVLAEAHAVVVTQWNEPALIRAVPEALDQGQVSLFYDPLVRLMSEETLYSSYELERYDAVLAGSGGLARLFRERLDLERVEVFPEAADTELFYPRPCRQDIDLLLIANGGEAMERPLRDYFLEQSLLFPHLRFCLYGVHYGEQARQQFRTAYRVDYRGWVPNPHTPPLYARSRLALHVFRDAPQAAASGPLTIRAFEALATRTCLVTSPWEDADHLLSDKDQYLRAASPMDLTAIIRYLLENRPARERIAEAGYRALLARHTCHHRAERLLEVIAACAKGAPLHATGAAAPASQPKPVHS